MVLFPEQVHRYVVVCKSPHNWLVRLATHLSALCDIYVCAAEMAPIRPINLAVFSYNSFYPHACGTGCD